MKKSLSATIWSIMDRVWAQFVSFVIGIVLARLLTPNDYGLVGISMIFISFSNVFIEAGFSNALIRKLDRSDIDYSTAFFFNIFMGLVLYLGIYISAPWIALFFEDNELILLIKIVGLSVFFNSLCIVPNAILTVDFKMRQQAIINISAQIPSGLLAIIMAYNDFGVYSLAVQTVLASFLRTLLFWIQTKWIPTLHFSMASMRYLWSFGSKLIGANCLGTIFNEIYTVLIGKYVGKSDLGLYSKSKSLAFQPELICNGVIQKVAVPILAQYQNDISLMKQKYKEIKGVLVGTMLLVSGLLIVCVKPVVLILWGEKWIDTAPIFQILVLTNIVSYPAYLSLVFLQVINRTGYTLKLEFIKKPICLLIILLMLNFGFYGLLWALVISTIYTTIINMLPVVKYLSYSYKEQFFGIYKYYLSLIGAVIISTIVSNVFDVNMFFELIIKAISFVGVYIVFLFVLKDEQTIKGLNMIEYKIKRLI